MNETLSRIPSEANGSVNAGHDYTSSVSPGMDSDELFGIQMHVFELGDVEFFVGLVQRQDFCGRQMQFFEFCIVTTVTGLLHRQPEILRMDRHS